MTMLKNELFESEDLIDNHLVTQQEWDDTKERLQIYNMDKIESLLLQEIKQKDGFINLEKFMDVLDLF